MKVMYQSITPVVDAMAFSMLMTPSVKIRKPPVHVFVACSTNAVTVGY